METFPEDLFETEKARIVSGDERWSGSQGGKGGGDHGIAVFG